MTRLLYRWLFTLFALWLLLALSEDLTAEKDKEVSETIIKSLSQTSPSDTSCPRYDQTHQILMGPQVMVDDCVNAITGTFCEMDVDLEVASTPLNLTRFFCSSPYSQRPLDDMEGLKEVHCVDLDHESVDLFRCWSWNHSTPLYWRPWQKTLRIANLVSGVREHLVVEVDKAKLDKEMFKGWTNTSFGFLGGQSNQHNRAAVYDGNWRVINEDGTIRYYQSYRTSIGKKGWQYWYSNETFRSLPNKLKIAYEYQKPFCVHQILVKSCDDKVMGSIDKKERTYFETSQGQSVRYHLKDYLFDHLKVPYKIERTHKPTVEYEYTQFPYAIVHTTKNYTRGVQDHCIYNRTTAPFITKKILPEGRFLEISYLEGFPKLWTRRHNLKGNVTPHVNAGKVGELRAPLDGESESKVKYSFVYEDDKTIVTDACGNIQEFFFDKEKRLQKVISKGNSQQSLTRHYCWSTGKSEGFLQKQWARDESGNVAYCKVFEYDDRGNVTAEHLHGNITGRSSGLKVDDKGEIKLVSESVTTRYEYHDNRFHTLKKEIHRDGREIDYVYAPESSLAIARFEKLNSIIVKRNFQAYDEFANIILSVDDDGSSEDPNDLTGVEVRRLKQCKAYESGPEIGLIKEETNSYWDRESGSNVLLNKTNYTYYPSRLIKTKSVWTEGCDKVAEYYYEYNAHGKATLERFPSGAQITRRYDENDNLVYECGPDLNLQTYYTYDTMNRLREKTEVYPDSQESIYYEYDLMGKLVKETFPHGVSREITYDCFGRPVAIDLPIQVDNEGNPLAAKVTEHYTYDAFGRVVEKRDGLGYVEKYAYNALDQLVLEQRQGEAPARHYYSIQGLRVETVMGTGSREIYTYDPLERRTGLKRYDSKGKLLFAQEFSYKGDRLSQIIDSTGRIENRLYDGAGRLIEKAIKESETTLLKEQWFYDGQDRQICHRQYANEFDYIDQLTAYDVMGQVTEKRSVTSGGQRVNQQLFEYDSSGRLVRHIKFTDGQKEEKLTQYDSHGRPICITDALGHKWQYQYECKLPYKGMVLDKVIEYRPDGTRKEEWRTFDDLPLEVKVFSADDALSYEAHFGYDPYKGVTYRNEKVILEGREIEDPVITRAFFGPARKVCKRIDVDESGFERVTSWDYDESGILKTTHLPSGINLFYTYDSMGLLERVLSSDGTIDQSFEHDSYGNATKITQKDGSYVLRTYNALGFIVFEEVVGEFGRCAVEKKYDALGRVLALQLPHEVAIKREYQDSFVRAVSMSGTLGSYEHQFLEYDGFGRIVREKFAGEIGQLHRSYDALGRVNHLKSDYFESKITNFDPMGRVLELRRGFDKMRRLSYQYDALGQLLEERSDDQATSYLHNSRQQRVLKNSDNYFNNQLGELLQVDGENITDFEYDIDGRVIRFTKTGVSSALSYDAFNRLIQISSEDGLIYQFFYDGFDRRVAKRKIFPEGESQTTCFVYDDQFEIGSLEETKWKEFRLVGLRSQAESGDTLLAIIDGAAYVTLQDLQGSIVGWVDLETKSLVARSEYDAFGVAEEGSERIGPWGYVAKRVDSGTGWIFYGKRYYLPSYGRWLTKDPKGEIDGSNLYAFLKNNPVYHWDLWGYASGHIGVKSPAIIDLVNNERSHAIADKIKTDFAYFQEKYPEQRRVNTFMIAVITDVEAPWNSEPNGILNSAEECIKRQTDHAIEHKCNLLTPYCASRGLLEDFTTPILRNYFKIDPHRPEYEMMGRTYDFCLEQNRLLNIGNTYAFPHSNGDHIALMGTNFMRNEHDAKNVIIRSLGGVGDRPKAAKSFFDYENQIDRYDLIARMGRGFLPRKDIKLVKISTRSGPHNHYIDSGVYRGLSKGYYQGSYRW